MLAISITDEVHKIRKEKSHGFLPDNHQWRILCDMIDQERFTRAAVAGHLTPDFLANSNKTALQECTNTLNGLTEEDFLAQIGRAWRERDPEVRRHPYWGFGLISDGTRTCRIFDDHHDRRSSRKGIRPINRSPEGDARSRREEAATEESSITALGRAKCPRRVLEEDTVKRDWQAWEKMVVGGAGHFLWFGLELFFLRMIPLLVAMGSWHWAIFSDVFRYIWSTESIGAMKNGALPPQEKQSSRDNPDVGSYSPRVNANGKEVNAQHIIDVSTILIHPR